MGLEIDRVGHWTKQIDRMLEGRQYDFARDTLRGIHNTIQENREVTDKQIRAIKNIQNGKNQAYN